ncbi:futalosine hydrolase [Alteribacillus sp. JSM 102045]|uniref:futalosine hydrolase n=1 Tax=Alteribacillus sp. JSM 102045 TaxID=1562101 RepID=UPI0035BF8A72
MTANKVLILTAVEAEREAVLRGLQDHPQFDVIAGGVGLAEAAASTAIALAKESYTAVVSAGIAGGFRGQTDLESIVVANEMWGADLGAETSKGFQSIDALGLGSSRYDCEPLLTEKLNTYISKIGLSTQTGPILTTVTVTGTFGTAEDLAGRIPGAKAEAMEGFGVAAAAKKIGVPAFEIRAISNFVGPRDRENWKIKGSLAALEQASKALQEVF